MNIFLAPGILKNIRRSIIDGVPASELGNLDADRSLADAVVKHYKKAPLRLWAVKKTLINSWRKCENGDLILFYNKGKFLFMGNVAFKYPFAEDAKQVEIGTKIAEDIWEKDVKGETWPYLMFLTDVKEIPDLSINKFKELTGYKFRGINGFMRMSKKSQPLVDYLQGVGPKPEITPVEKRIPKTKHEQIIELIYELGEVIGYDPKKKWHHQRYEFDVVWFKPPREGPKYVFEVHLRGSLPKALSTLKHAWDLWESNVFLVSDEKSLKEAEDKFLSGAFHEMREKLTLVKLDEVEEFYKFKGKFEWLERRFGLTP